MDNTEQYIDYAGAKFLKLLMLNENTNKLLEFNC